MSWRLVLVQLGTSKPDHLVSNLRRINHLFPVVQPVVVVDNAEVKTFIESARVNVEVFDYQRNNFDLDVDLDFDFLEYNRGFRKGFWRYSTERFFALAAWQLKNPEIKLLHIESDIMLMPNFPFETLANLDCLAWQTVSNDHDVAAVFYSPNPDNLVWLCRQLGQRIRNGSNLNDMLLLGEVRKQHPDRIVTLPSWAPTWAKPENLSQEEFLRISGAQARVISGVIDGSTIGVWLTGQDPRNNKGFLLLHEDFAGSATDTRMLEFQVDPLGNLFASNSGNRAAIYCLHIHSKNVHLLSPSGHRYLDKFALLANDKGRRVQNFAPRAFLQWCSPLLPELFVPANYARLFKRLLRSTGDASAK